MVNNRPGGGQVIAMDLMLKAPPDGYSLAVASHGIAYVDATIKNMPFVPLRDIRALSMLAASGLSIVVHPDFPAKTMQEFVSYVRANPGKVNFGTVGPYPVPKIADMRTRLNMDWTEVPYPGGAAAFTALVSGSVQAFNSTPFSAVPFIKSGKIRVLAYADDQRHPLIPDVPTVAETVLPKMRSRVWFGLFGSSALPQDISARLNAEMNEMMKNPESRTKLEGMGYQLFPMDLAGVQAEFAQAGKTGTEIYARIGIKPQ